MHTFHHLYTLYLDNVAVMSWSKMSVHLSFIFVDLYYYCKMVISIKFSLCVFFLHFNFWPMLLFDLIFKIQYNTMQYSLLPKVWAPTGIHVDYTDNYHTPRNEVRGVYWNHHVRPSVCPAAFGFPAHNCFPFTPIIMKLHMQTPHESRMCGPGCAL